MKQDSFKCLPAEIITNIISRLPVDTIASSKCVCKPWRDLLKTDEFVDSHLAKSLPSLAIMTPKPPLCCFRVLEFEDDFGYYQVTKFDFPLEATTTIDGSANGLLLLRNIDDSRAQRILYICNPITRHYVEIPAPKWWNAFGFGVSRITGQYKVVGINSKSQCCVYTLGTGSWRYVVVEAACASLLLKLGYYINAFLDGNLHWSIRGYDSRASIVCFDLETECFSSFLAPAPRGGLSVVRDCLCFCEWKDENCVVWLMKEYGVEKSWSKEHVIRRGPINIAYGCDIVYPIKVFKNGDMVLMFLANMIPIYYSNKTKTIQKIGSFPSFLDVDDFISTLTTSRPLTPSFVSLKGLGMENVISF